MNAILVDVTRCTGCSECIDACVTANHLGEDLPAPQQAPDGLSARRWAAIVQSKEGANVRKFCRHCLEPACVSVCPVGAMYKTEEGPVLYDGDRCMGCRYCMMACPFGIPRYQWESKAPLVQKCNMCYERTQEGQLPACVEACPERALMFGEREELIAVARQRIVAEPAKYLQTINGETEAGGTSVLYISDVPLEVLPFHEMPGAKPLPELSANWLNKVPGLAVTTAGLMSGLFWIIGRRIQVEEARAIQAAADAAVTEDTAANEEEA